MSGDTDLDCGEAHSRPRRRPTDHENGFKAKRREAMIRQMVREYRHAIRQFATMKTLDVWYARGLWVPETRSGVR